MLPNEVALRETLAFVQQHLPASGRLLEVGCGSGELAARLQKAGHHVIALDSDAAVINQARQLGIDARVAVQTFEVVLSTLMMHHLPDDLKRAGLAEIARVLKPGGRLLILDMKDLADELALMTQAGFSPTTKGETGLRGLNFVLASILREGKENAS